MHRGHDDHAHDHHGGPGHNHAARPRPPVQWQTPHRVGEPAPAPETPAEPDVDLVEAAFVEGFMVAGDATSFLRLARVPFEAKHADGRRLVLLRVEIDAVTDVGGITPHLGGTSFRYDPLPDAIVSRRRRLRFIYFDGKGILPLDLGAVRGLLEG